uniref:Uncharacterized protein n=1 Tax=Odontella aurita TaxID=265563 RepID=A0A7S4M5U8_9STRA|mmetsp:Transcript_11527/g.33957  ORF Transcript_11527/g.33957 Transcript_11527/m.33957 type:complete len:251 (+) Transcript_11527:189-941(+)
MASFASRILALGVALLCTNPIAGFVRPPKGKNIASTDKHLSLSQLSRGPARSLLFYKHLDDDERLAERLPLSTADIARLSEMRSRQQTIPIMILDAMLPGQHLEFGSDDPRFGKLIEHVLSEGSTEMGMIGLNPHTGSPLNIGVTLTVEKENMNFNPLTRQLTLAAKGRHRFEVQGEPWLDETKSFYMADVEIVDNREESMSDQDKHMAVDLAERIPTLFESWLRWVVKSGKSTTEDMEKRIKVGALRLN